VPYFVIAELISFLLHSSFVVYGPHNLLFVKNM
jgi:hypothetical protein